MFWKTFFCGLGALMLTGSIRAADPPRFGVFVVADDSAQAGQTAQNPPNVLYFRADPNEPVPAVQTSDERAMKMIIGPPSPDVIRGEFMPVPVQRVIQDQSEYWLGVECYPAPAMLRVHLNLPDNQGLLVARVVPESPAAKAGLVENDLLMQAGEKKFGGVPDLSEAVEAAKDSPLELEIIHAGKAKAVTVIPEKRPANMVIRPLGNASDWNQIQQWAQKMQSGAAANLPGRVRFQVIQPGAILPPGTPVEPAMPGNMSININRNGNEPAKINVKWNDKTWDITEKELDKLPAEVRPHVERMLGHGKFQATLYGSTGGGAAVGIGNAEVTDVFVPAPPPGLPGAQGLQMQVRPFRSVEDRLEELSRKIEQLQNELRANRADNPPPAAEKAEPEKDTTPPTDAAPQEKLPAPAEEPAK
jgi:hypothetical protein